MHTKLAIATILLGLAACSHEEGMQKLVTDMAVLDESVIAAMRDAPDEAGIAKAENLVASQADALHTRYVDISGSNVFIENASIVNARCAANAAAVSIGRDYVKNGLVARGADEELRRRLLQRVDALEKRMVAICKL